MKPPARLAAFGIDVLTGIGIALAVAAMLLALFTPPPSTPPRVSAPTPIITRPAPARTTIRPDLSALTVTQLRTVVRHQLGSATRINGRRIAQARRADLLQALS